MPEVWLNYGSVDAVVDIRAENLGETLDGGAKVLVQERLDGMLADLSVDESTVLVVLNDTASVRHIISSLYSICEAQSTTFPRILADDDVRKSIREGLPEGSAVGLFDRQGKMADNLMFVAEVEPDGLFGYQTVCTRLLRKFEHKRMLEAYECRAGDSPAPGSDVPSYGVAKEFAEKFDVSCIEVAGGSEGIYSLYAGHPAACDAHALAGPYVVGSSVRARTVVGSTGMKFGSSTLSSSLPSLWSMWGALKPGGHAILLAECGGGLGSSALLKHAEGNLELSHPREYVAGMEDVLFAKTVVGDVNVTLVTALPDLYANNLEITTARQAQSVLNTILAKDPRHKITILPDAGRTILRQESGGERSTEAG